MIRKRIGTVLTRVLLLDNVVDGWKRRFLAGLLYTWDFDYMSGIFKRRKSRIIYC